MLPVPPIAPECPCAPSRARIWLMAGVLIALLAAAAPAARAAKHQSAGAGPAARDALRVQLSGPAVVGVPVGFHALAPSAPAGGAVTYQWFWDRSGSDVTRIPVPDATHVFTRAGSVLVTLVVSDAHGELARTHQRVVVEAARRRVAVHGERGHASDPKRREHANRRAIATAGHSATTVTVAIKDFSFAPGSITVHAGDTVTWVNEGPSSHTATVRGGFDSGVLSRGQSASHVFTSPGTLSYFCSIHPFMRATVVVLASAATNTTSEGSAGSKSPASSERSSSSERTSSSSTPAGGQVEPAAPGPQLPNTGLNLLVEFLAGLSLLSLGLALALIARRRRSSASRRAHPADRAPRG
jgi:LPXTG-motif cell wall-anchored protein